MYEKIYRCDDVAYGCRMPIVDRAWVDWHGCLRTRGAIALHGFLGQRISVVAWREFASGKRVRPAERSNPQVTRARGWMGRDRRRFRRRGGLVLRFSDNENYYLLAIRDDQAPFPRSRDNLEIYRRTGEGQGGFVSLWRMDVSWPRGILHQVRFEISDDNLRVYFDDNQVASLSDVMHLSGGGIGVRHYGNDASWITRYRRLSWGKISQ